MNPALAELLDLSRRTAIVTGGAMGIGRGIAERLHEAGANVVVADLEEADWSGDRRRAVQTDVAEARSVEAMVAATVDAFGGIDVLVNNAGIYPFAPLVQMSEADFMRVIDVNLRGVFLCTKAVVARMIEQGRGGRIVNVTSIDAIHPSMVGLAHYDSSKHGVWGFTKNVALELAPHGILVNAIAPGAILTPGVGAVDPETSAGITAAIPLRRFGDADEIGRAALFLASGLSSYMTGSQVVVDGGMLLT